MATANYSASSMASTLSIVSGPTTPELWHKKLGDLVDEQATRYGDRTATAFPWQNVRLSYSQLVDRSRTLAKSLLAYGLKHGDCVAIMAGNRFEYIEAFLAAARIGCPFVVLNNTYSPDELVVGLSASSSKLLFIASNIGPKLLSNHLDRVTNSAATLQALKHVVLLSEVEKPSSPTLQISTYSKFVSAAGSITHGHLKLAEQHVQPTDIVNLQFTSGTTGSPKAAMLSHINILNNGRFVGGKMRLNSSDVVCCPPPLFHCFGLVMGFLSSLAHGSNIVFPCDQFDPNLVLKALAEEKCTTLLGVPTMFISAITTNKHKGYKISSVKTALAAGSSVPSILMQQLQREFGLQNMLIAYGMTETSPVTFMTDLSDNEEQRTKTVGQVMPHTRAKVIDRQGNIVPLGVPGELCTSGYALQKGYWENPAKTNEVMIRDEHGELWMHTGDECVIDHLEYCRVTGRIKDLIIRGGENILPLEIEERLLQHQAISEVSVVAIKDDKYGEVVGAFLKEKEGESRPTTEELVQWVRKVLGSHKAPKYCFWIGDQGVGDDFPKTGSGKYQKHILRDIGNKLTASKRQDEEAIKAKL